MNILKEEKAQVSLDYLLIIAGAIVIVTAVSLYIKSAANSAAEAANSKINNQ